MALSKSLYVFAFVVILAGCTSQPPIAHLSGKVTLKGQPVPAGWISFTPDAGGGTLGLVKVMQIKDGAYDSSKENPPGIPPGKYFVKIAGFDGKKIPMYGQGKQIFNMVEEKCTIEPGAATKDWIIPESASENVKIQPTADN